MTAGLPPRLTGSSSRRFLSFLLSVCLVLFLADAVVSVLDETLILLGGIRMLAAPRFFITLLASLGAMLVYLLLGLTPIVPKRLFLPMTLFIPVATLATIPLLIYHHEHHGMIILGASVCQLACGLVVLRLAQGAVRFQWPLIPVAQLGTRAFSGWNLSGFVLGNVFLLAPAAVLYLMYCLALATDHFSAGFLALHPSGLSARAGAYARSDGKTIHLVPMMHIARPGFYREIENSLPDGSVILTEGVKDGRRRLKHNLTYGKAASALGLVEQRAEFQPKHSRERWADVDIERFSAGTIEILDQTALIYSQGPNLANILKLLHKSQDPVRSEQLMEDILLKRNEHLAGEIRKELENSDVIVVPWGALHMPGISEEIQKLGFKHIGSREFTIVSFRGNAAPSVKPRME